ncbi:hypothetical protein JQ621_31525 [Bradyrhizobium manausense]|uniref:BTAD domain-containing putative transcriptional regulator n=1 Tax=Bradyrhizobium manausense TaxID=989370 RepID=UPI001BA65132|nr:BTAD domain-containing putative transcriptional regulator [Bradyrhizobium manausense]MBR1092012.1 hypothetical protein [Bradyrhizobium manausense]
MAGLLWEDRPPEQALVSLRQELARLRNALQSKRLEEWSAGNALKFPSGWTIDVQLLLEAAASGDAANVAALYSGSFMGDEEPRGERLTQWLTETRSFIAAKALSACEASLSRDSGLSAEQQEKIAELITRLNPAAQIAHIKLIEAYASQNKTAQAIEYYRKFSAGLSARGQQVPSAAEELLARLLRSSRPHDRAPTIFSDGIDWLDDINRQHDEAMAPSPCALTPPRDRPSIAVLPFRDVTPLGQTLAGFADGFTEEATTALARLRNLFVTARQSSQVYRFEAKDIRQISLELGVSYLVEGSVEKAPHSVRVHARLINGATGLAIWGDVFEAEMRRFIDARDRLVNELVARLSPAVMQQEIANALSRQPGDFDAWTHYQRAQGYVLFTRNPERLSSAVAELRSALRRDGQYAMAKALLASVYTMRSLWGTHPRAAVEKKAAVRLSNSALRLDPENPSVLINCADTALYSAGDLDNSLRLLKKAVIVDPSDAHGLALFANVNRCADGDIDQSLDLLTKAMRLSPRDPRSHRWYHYSAWAYWKQNKLADMESAARQAISLYSDAPAQWIALTCSLGLQHRRREAVKAASILKQMIPAFTAQAFFGIAKNFYKDRFPREEDGYRRLCSALEDALTGKM